MIPYSHLSNKPKRNLLLRLSTIALTHYVVTERPKCSFPKSENKIKQILECSHPNKAARLDFAIDEFP